MNSATLREQCQRFEKCDAPLCPLDEDIEKRVWYVGEEICRAQKHNKHRWIKKQRSIVRRQTKTWLDKAITYEMLYNASRPPKNREVTQAQLAALAKARANSPRFMRVAA